MPCYMKKNLTNIEKSACDTLPYFGIHESCEQMDKYACDNTSNCCYWKWSTGAIVGFIIAGCAGLFCIIFMILYIRKYYFKSK